MKNQPRRYWDACAFLGLLAEEPDKIDECNSVIRAAEKGEVRLITSAVTLTEVIKIKGSPRLKEEDEEKIRKYFENSYITVVNADRPLAEDARHLIWQFPKLDPKDAIHLATAIYAECPHLDTFDSDLLDLNGQLDGVLMHIGRPHLPHQYQLPGDGGKAQ